MAAPLIYGQNLDQRYKRWNNRRRIMFRRFNNNYAAQISILIYSKGFYLVGMKSIVCILSGISCVPSMVAVLFTRERVVVFGGIGTTEADGRNSGIW